MLNSQPVLSQGLVRKEGGRETFYLYGLGLIGKYRAYHFDVRGSTVALTNEQGEVVGRFGYGPYGELVVGEGTETPFLFNGQFGVMSDGNGLYYMRARFYSPLIKRFVNQDVVVGRVGEGQSLNRFAFVSGRPVSFVDPFGLDAAQFHDIYLWIHRNYPELTYKIDRKGKVSMVIISVNPVIDFLRSLGYGIDGWAYGNVVSVRKAYVNFFLDYTYSKWDNDWKLTLNEESLMNILVHELLHIYIFNQSGGMLNYLFSSEQKELHEWIYQKAAEITLYWKGTVVRGYPKPTLDDFPNKEKNLVKSIILGSEQGKPSCHK